MTIYFDMDNTLNQLKLVNNVWKRLDNKEVYPYYEAKPNNKWIDLLKSLHDVGHKIVILSCLSRVTDEQFDDEVCLAKDIWLNEHVGMSYIDDVMYIPYTKDKSMYVKDEGVLIDDDSTICGNWSMGCAIIAQ